MPKRLLHSSVNYFLVNTNLHVFQVPHILIVALYITFGVEKVKTAVSVWITRGTFGQSLMTTDYILCRGILLTPLLCKKRKLWNKVWSLVTFLQWVYCAEHLQCRIQTSSTMKDNIRYIKWYIYINDIYSNMINI